MTDDFPAPLIVLSSHRSGSSTVMGLLVGMGLEVGEVLPPQSDNPKGFFESVQIVKENRRILASMDRDWTCPPRSLAPSAINREKLARAVDEAVADRARPWGFKDPRTLFTLEAWLSVLGSVRLLGVYRPAGSVARSLETRDHFSQTAAESIATLYNERLAHLHQELGFPIVRFGGDRDVMLEQLKDVSRQLDLVWEPEFARGFFESDLIHHTAPENLIPADQYLESVVDTNVDLAVMTVDRALSALRRVESNGMHNPASPYLGPQFLVRRTRLWNLLRALGGEVESVLELLPDDRRQFKALEGADVGPYRRMGVGKVRDLESAGTYTHVLGPDVLDVIAPEELDEFLAKLKALTDVDGVVGLSGQLVDDRGIADLSNASAASGSDVDQPPYRHERDELEHATRRQGWHISTWREDLNVVVLARSALRSDPTVLSPSEMRTELKRALDENAGLERRLAELSSELTDVKRDYARLRSRRIVRASLALARPLKPVFKRVRVSRQTRESAPAHGSSGPEANRMPEEPEEPYEHLRLTPDGSFASSERSSTAFRLPARRLKPGVHRASISVGLFLPGTKHFPPSTHVRILRRLYHSSMEGLVDPMVLNAERFVASPSPTQFDVALVQRTGVPADVTDDFLKLLDARGTPLVLDLDDDLIGMTANHPNFHVFGDMRGTLERLARRADLITASTDALRERLESYNSNVVTVLNALDAELWFSPFASRDRSPGERAGSFRLLYFGTRTHQNDLPLVEEFVRDPGNSTTLTVVGGVPPGSLEWFELVDPPRSDREYPFFVRWLKAYAADFDAVIAPLADTEFNEAKSDLKFLEGTALGLPVICSDVRAFESLKGRNVALMPGPSPAEWSDAITSLRDEPDLRDALARAGEAYVKAERLIGQETTAYSRLLADVTANATLD